MEFSEKLKEAMQDLDLNQKQVVGMTGKSKGSISQYLSGKQVPSEKAQSDIAVSLGLNPDYFKNEENPVSCHIPRKGKRTYEHKKEQAAAVERWIQNIEDGQTRYVFKAFYQQGMTWEKIAEKTGYFQSPDYPRLYIRDTYLKKCEIK